MLDDTDDTDDDEDVAVPRRKSPRKSASKKAPSPPRPPTIAPPIPQSPDYESELLIHRSRKSTPRRLVLSPTTPPRSSSPASPPTALPTLFEQRSNIGSKKVLREKERERDCFILNNMCILIYHFQIIIILIKLNCVDIQLSSPNNSYNVFTMF